MSARIQEFGDEQPDLVRWVCHDHGNYVLGPWDTNRDYVQERADGHNAMYHAPGAAQS